MALHRSLLVLLVILVLSLNEAYADPIPALDLALLTSTSDQIVVGEVIAIQEGEETGINIQGQPVMAIRTWGKLRIDRVLKGQSHARILSFEHVATNFGPYKQILPNQYGMFFLRLKSPKEYVVSDPYYPFLVASREPMASEGTVFDKVVAEVVHVLAVKGSYADRGRAIRVLKTVEMESATVALRQAASDSDSALRLEAIAALLWRNDISSLDAAVANLLNPTSGTERRLLKNLAAAVEGIKDPRAIPLLANLLTCPDAFTRRASASALRHTAANTAIQPLLIALRDSDW